jgi:monofunctional glycosyltransferase
LVLVLGGAAWWLSPAPEVDEWAVGPTPRGWASLERQEEAWRRDGLNRRPAHSYRRFGEISPDLVLAVLVGEDVNFLRHDFLDPAAIWEAIGEWHRGARLRGASTISQQLARILFLSAERSVSRKLAEARLAWWLERRLSKRRILELYVNTVEFGPGLFGAEAASWHYFGVGAATVGPAEAAQLAAGIPSPGRDNPSTRTARWELRRSLIAERSARAVLLRVQLVELAAAAEEAGGASARDHS